MKLEDSLSRVFPVEATDLWGYNTYLSKGAKSPAYKCCCFCAPCNKYFIGSSDSSASLYSWIFLLEATWKTQIKAYKFKLTSTIYNKKDVLRERKRHTARHIASTCCAALSPGGGRGVVPNAVQRGGGGVTPIQSIWGGVAHSSLRGYPHFQAGWGTPCQAGWGYPLVRLDAPPPSLSGVLFPPPPSGWMGWGYPHVDKQTFPSINITFPGTSYADAKNLLLFTVEYTITFTKQLNNRLNRVLCLVHKYTSKFKTVHTVMLTQT